jgi:dihydrolipoamide dehydrogenase
MNAQYYDVVIIGAGPAGIMAAKLLHSNGIKPLIISENIGGNYCFSGSVVSNTLLHISSVYEAFIKDFSRFVNNFNINNLSAIDYEKIKKYVETTSQRISKYIGDELEDKADFLSGRATFIDSHALQIAFPKGKEQMVNFKKAIIATGSKPKIFETPNNVKLLRPENILSMGGLPKSIAIIGGGFVGCEYAVFFNRLNVQVSIIERRGRILTHFEEQAVKKVEEQFKKEGISIYKNRKIMHIDKIGNKSIIFCDGGEQFESEEVLISIGRVPSLSSLKVDNSLISMRNDLPILNENFTSTNRDIYIVGDASGIGMNVAFAIFSAERAVNNILNKEECPGRFVFPRMLCLNPDIASVGYDEFEAISEGYNIGVVKYAYSYLKKHIIESAQNGFIKLVYDRYSGCILGAHIFGRGGSDIISEFTLIMQANITIDKLPNVFFNHPTYAEIIKEFGQMIVG